MFRGLFDGCRHGLNAYLGNRMRGYIVGKTGGSQSITRLMVADKVSGGKNITSAGGVYLLNGDTGHMHGRLPLQHQTSFWAPCQYQQFAPHPIVPERSHVWQIFFAENNNIGQR